jgi:hypothetical protein
VYDVEKFEHETEIIGNDPKGRNQQCPKVDIPPLFESGEAENQELNGVVVGNGGENRDKGRVKAFTAGIDTLREALVPVRCGGIAHGYQRVEALVTVRIWATRDGRWW